MSRPHVICSITIYDPLTSDHKKKSSMAKTRLYPFMLIVDTATAVFQKHAGSREDGLTHLVNKDFCTFLGWLPAASVGYRCEVIVRL